MGHHQHGHSHDHGPASYGKAFAIGISLNVLYVAVEGFYGFTVDSSALLADAGHNLSDVLSLVFAWAAITLAGKKPSRRYTYGLRRTTILVSILNALLLFVAAGGIGWDAWNKLITPRAVPGTTIMWVATVGIVINTATALLFIKGQKEDLNIKGAFLHMAADAAVSLGVVIAGLLIQQTGAYWIDPAISFVILLVIVYGTWQLFVDSLNLALDAVPKDIDIDKVEAYLESIDGVEEVHDLHVWAMSTTQTALTAHLVMPEGASDQFLFDIRHKLEEEFGIGHTTLQIEKTFGDEAYRPGCC